MIKHFLVSASFICLVVMSACAPQSVVDVKNNQSTTDPVATSESSDLATTAIAETASLIPVLATETNPSPSLAQARDIALDYVISQYHLPGPGEWVEEELTASLPVWIESRFISGPWVVTVSAEASAPSPAGFHVVADNLSEAVRWEGIISAGGSVDEILFTRAGPDMQTGGTQLLQQWSGSITSLPAGSQFDDVFTDFMKDQTACGLDGSSPEINQLIEQYRDSNVLVTIEGSLSLNVPDVNNCQIRVTSLTPSGFIN